jgi:hypothetical protein
MHAGTISAVDSHRRFGLIDADDGCIVPFNQHAFQHSVPELLELGARVEFIEATVEDETRAVAVRVQAST